MLGRNEGDFEYIQKINQEFLQFRNVIAELQKKPAIL